LRGFRHPTRLLAKSGGASAALKKWCGYRDGPHHAPSRHRYVSGCRELSKQFQHASDEWRIPEALDTLMFYPDPFKIDWTRCPIIIDDRHGLLKSLGIQVSFFSAVTVSQETPSFVRAFRKLDQTIQKLWRRRKADLARSTQLASLDFKQWVPGGPNCWSVRIDGNYRAHLRRNASIWSAFDIGTHKAMGHG
jgi:hypothetical protein